MNWINPFRKEMVGEFYILYTTKAGGEFKIFAGFDNKYTKKIFKDAVKNGYIKIKISDKKPPKRKLAFIALLKVKDNWDFVIEKINKDKGLNG